MSKTAYSASIALVITVFVYNLMRMEYLTNDLFFSCLFLTFVTHMIEDEETSYNTVELVYCVFWICKVVFFGTDDEFVFVTATYMLFEFILFIMNKF